MFSMLRYEERAADSPRGDQNVSESDPEEAQEWVLVVVFILGFVYVSLT